MRNKRDDYDCLLSMPDLGTYVGKWIVIVNNSVISTGTAAKEVFAEAKRKYPDSKPLLVKVPQETAMLL